ncbi:MAG: hypothetical protein ACTS40_00300 [Candidatus Hodgkinia cicadicola]
MFIGYNPFVWVWSIQTFNPSLRWTINSFNLVRDGSLQLIVDFNVPSKFKTPSAVKLTLANCLQSHPRCIVQPFWTSFAKLVLRSLESSVKLTLTSNGMLLSIKLPQRKSLDYFRSNFI